MRVFFYLCDKMGGGVQKRIGMVSRHSDADNGKNV